MKKERYCFYKDQSYQEAYPRLGETFQFLSFFFFFKFICLFSRLYWVFAAVHGLSLVVASRGCSLVAVWRPLISVVSLVAEHRLQAHAVQQSQCVGSVVVAPGLQSADSVAVVLRLSWLMACGILPDQGSNLCPWHWQANSSPLNHQQSLKPFNFRGLQTLVNCVAYKTYQKLSIGDTGVAKPE